MISFAEAFELVLSHPLALGTEQIPLEDCGGRILAGEVYSDRDLPPFDRATMDGIALAYAAFREGQRDFPIRGEARAGTPLQCLNDPATCMEVMTGAMVPEGADTVVRYEDLEIREGVAWIKAPVNRGQNIHPRGSDSGAGKLLLSPGQAIGPAEMAVLASVGKSVAEVFALPRTSLFSTGDELVPVDASPLPHQIRRSNIYALQSALGELRIHPNVGHLPDHPEKIQCTLATALDQPGVVLLSGGVSMGKYDYLPGLFAELGVENIFHRVAQRPGKPFWFGINRHSGCLVFSFPGNPVSTFLNYHLYFKAWLWNCWGLELKKHQVLLPETEENTTPLTQFRLGEVREDQGKLVFSAVPMNSSGDFLSLSRAHGFACLEPRETPYLAGESVPFHYYKSLLS
ncbi:molybdopterin molybdotransferase MoeA [Robiginitalea marina]|uniref:Molybdopterin molybdenumtransferase n=1 Tax=Robiginitalea marina TaxID=2954105 RepID=A0ABT1AU44_9FLAO|nr:molybdopterin molybdotransferase MoeA [Robiginitalea marina]MCO5723526.1 molybdopterin molybdotransferase MoeA [Robiginitalea marina]